MTFWSGDTLLARANKEKLVQPYDPGRIDCASYQLGVGREIYVSPTASEEKPEASTKRILEYGEEFEIKPGQFAYIITEETVKIPPNALAFISVRARYKLRGLVNISGFHVDPGYQGKLVFSVLNAGPRAVTLAQNEPCFLIFFADLDEASETHIKKKPGHTTISGEVLDYVRGDMQSLDSLSKTTTELAGRVDKAEIRYENNKTLFTIGVSALVVIVVQLALLIAKAFWPEPAAVPMTIVTPAPTVQILQQPETQPPAPTRQQ